MSLAEAVEKRAELLTELVAHSDSAVVQALLSAEKCYQPNSLAAVAQLTKKLGNGNVVIERLQQATRHEDPTIQKEAVRYLGAMQNPQLIPTFEEVLTRTVNVPEVAYRAIVALEQLASSGAADRSAIVRGLQLALKNNSAQVRMHAAKTTRQHPIRSCYPGSRAAACRSE